MAVEELFLYKKKISNLILRNLITELKRKRKHNISTGYTQAKIWILQELIEQSYKNGEFKIGDRIVARDCWGKWYNATILYVKQVHQTLDENVKLSRYQPYNEVNNLVGIYVSYDGWSEKWNDWIFIHNNVFCSCKYGCNTPKGLGHRIAPLNTQIHNFVKLQRKK